ncbi:hypothetical protein AY599_10410 [Leptolyngbya valderiana BDU 20041]|nr:hypothetical protein AY599_10410 [Leptolyngbya valderiana BDU 20041]
MTEPVFWLGLSLGIVAFSLVAVTLTLIPAVRELQRAANSIEKLADTLSRELPPTLEVFRSTGLEIGELTDEVSTGVKNAGEVVGHVNQSVSSVKQQTQRVRGTTRGFVAGVKAAWQVWQRGEHPATRSEPSVSSSSPISFAEKPEDTHNGNSKAVSEPETPMVDEEIR